MEVQAKSQQFVVSVRLLRDQGMVKAAKTRIGNREVEEGEDTKTWGVN